MRKVRPNLNPWILRVSKHLMASQSATVAGRHAEALRHARSGVDSAREVEYAAILQAFAAGMTHGEIGEQFGCTKQAIQKRLSAPRLPFRQAKGTRNRVDGAPVSRASGVDAKD